MDAIRVTNLKKSFKVGKESVEVLKNISFTVEKGEFVSIMGPSGGGKSTLLYLLGGLDDITSGTVKIFGKDISKMKDPEKSRLRCRDLGFIFQFYNLIPTLTIYENIMMPIVLDKKRMKDYKEKVEEIIEIVGLKDRMHYTPNELSGGQQQRVAIARALINDPKIILADEPIGNLDSKTGKEIMELLASINEKQDKTIVMVTHSLESSEYANMRINLKDGEVIK